MFTLLLCLKTIKVSVPKPLKYHIIFLANQQFCFGIDLVKNLKLIKIMKEALKVNNFHLFLTAYKKSSQKKFYLSDEKFITKCRISSKVVYDFFMKKNVKLSNILCGICYSENNYDFFISVINNFHLYKFNPRNCYVYALRGGNTKIADYFSHHFDVLDLGSVKKPRLIKKNCFEVLDYIRLNNEKIINYYKLDSDIFHSNNRELFEQNITGVYLVLKYLIKYDLPLPKVIYDPKLQHHLVYNEESILETAIKVCNENYIKKYITIDNFRNFPDAPAKSHKIIFDHLKIKPSIYFMIYNIDSLEHIRLFMSYHEKDEITDENFFIEIKKIASEKLTTTKKKILSCIFKKCKKLRRRLLREFDTQYPNHQNKFIEIYRI